MSVRETHPNALAWRRGSDELRCPNCGEENPSGVRYCNECRIYLGAIGSYCFLRRLSRGGFGEVYQGINYRTGYPVAIKVMLPHLAKNAEARQRFSREASMLQKLQHPHIVRIFDAGESKHLGPYMAMEWLDGQELKAYVQGFSEGLPLREVLSLFAQLLDGLQKIHELGIVHRDLKPENLMLVQESKHQVLKIIDFGISKQTESGSTLTSASKVIGTPHFMSPEQLDKSITTTRTDLYAAGVLLFWLLTGELPFDSESPHKITYMHFNEPPPSLESVRPGRPHLAPFEGVIQQAMAKAPEERHASALDFLEAVHTAYLKAEEGRSYLETFAFQVWSEQVHREGPPSVEVEGKTSADDGEELPSSKDRTPKAFESTGNLGSSSSHRMHTPLLATPSPLRSSAESQSAFVPTDELDAAVLSPPKAPEPIEQAKDPRVGESKASNRPLARGPWAALILLFLFGGWGLYRGLNATSSQPRPKALLPIERTKVPDSGGGATLPRRQPARRFKRPPARRSKRPPDRRPIEEQPAPGRRMLEQLRLHLRHHDCLRRPAPLKVRGCQKAFKELKGLMRSKAMGSKKATLRRWYKRLSVVYVSLELRAAQRGVKAFVQGQVPQPLPHRFIQPKGQPLLLKLKKAGFFGCSLRWRASKDRRWTLAQLTENPGSVGDTIEGSCRYR